MIQKSIRFKLILTCIALATIPILIISAILSSQSSSALKDSASQQLEVEADRVAIAVGNYIRELQNILTLTAKTRSFISLPTPQKKQILEELLSYENRFDDFKLITPEGKVLIHLNRVHFIPQNQDAHYSDLEEIGSVMKSQTTHFGDISFNSNGEPRLVMTIPLISIYTGQIKFILFSTIRLKKVWDILAELSQSDNTVMLVDSAGNIVGHPDPSIPLSRRQFLVPPFKTGVGVTLKGEPAILATKTLVYEDRQLTIISYKTLDKALELSHRILRINLWIIIPALLVAIALAIIIIGNIIKPLQHLIHITDKIQQGDLTQRVESYRDDEFGKLGESFNKMTIKLQKSIKNLEIEIQEKAQEIADRKKSEKEKAILESKLRHSHKMEAIGTMAGGISHDFNNILAIILGYAEVASENADLNESNKNEIVQIIKAADRAKQLVQQILRFSRMSELKKDYEPIRLGEIVKEVLSFQRSITSSTIEIRHNIDATSYLINGDPTQIHQILLNLCNNAVHALEKTGGLLEVSLYNCSTPKFPPPEYNPSIREYVCLTVKDNGMGIKKEHLGNIFDPYFTTRKMGKGSGMGLAVTHGIVKSHEGFIIVESTPNVGSIFKLYFPAITQKAIGSPSLAQETPKTGFGNVLFLDDESLIVTMGKVTLERLGYSITTFTDATKALKEFQSAPEKFDLVITDQNMPKMRGTEFSQAILKIRPNIPIILCTGYSETVTQEEIEKIGIKEYVLKPFTRQTIADALHRVLQS